MKQVLMFVWILVIVSALTHIAPCVECAESPADTPTCPPVCMIECLFGNVIDANGCPTCHCNPPPKMTTPRPPFLECHTWMKCAQGVCPYGCGCQPNC